MPQSVGRIVEPILGTVLKLFARLSSYDQFYISHDNTIDVTFVVLVGLLIVLDLSASHGGGGKIL
jgi:hypothetical protein